MTVRINTVDAPRAGMVGEKGEVSKGSKILIRMETVLGDLTTNIRLMEIFQSMSFGRLNDSSVLSQQSTKSIDLFEVKI